MSDALRVRAEILDKLPNITARGGIADQLVSAVATQIAQENRRIQRRLFVLLTLWLVAFHVGVWIAA